MSLNLNEFLEVYGTEDILDWWTNAKLPHPGCPVGFKIVQQLVLVSHKIPFSQKEKREQAVKETLGIVHLIDGTFDTTRWCWKSQDRTILVPLSNDYDEQTDWQLLYILYGKGNS